MPPVKYLCKSQNIGDCLRIGKLPRSEEDLIDVLHSNGAMDIDPVKSWREM
jgi:hypothetical protein